VPEATVNPSQCAVQCKRMSWSDPSGSIGPVQLRPGWLGQRPENPGSMKRKEEEVDESWKEEKILIAALACQDAAFTPQGGA
jgi:hypothetical protein